MTGKNSDSEIYQAASMMLAMHDGLFIGENHTMAMAPDFLITHMADFKEAGVTTIYMERDHQIIAAGMIGGDCVKQYYGESVERSDGIKSIMGERK